MNERIKELADYAAKYSAVMAMKSDRSANELFVEQLVRSVVQECVHRIEGCAVDPAHFEFDQDFVKGYNKAISKSASQVLLHFDIDN